MCGRFFNRGRGCIDHKHSMPFKPVYRDGNGKYFVKK